METQAPILDLCFIEKSVVYIVVATDFRSALVFRRFISDDTCTGLGYIGLFNRAGYMQSAQINSSSVHVGL